MLDGCRSSVLKKCIDVDHKVINTKVVNVPALYLKVAKMVHLFQVQLIKKFTQILIMNKLRHLQYQLSIVWFNPQRYISKANCCLIYMHDLTEFNQILKTQYGVMVISLVSLLEI